MTAEQIKAQFVEHLKQQAIKDALDLWGYAKDFARRNLWVMGGSYASFSEKVSIRLLIGGLSYQFNITLSEVQQQKQKTTKINYTLCK